MEGTSSSADVQVRAKIEKFDGNPPTRANDAWRRVALLGPKLPKEIITIDGDKVEVEVPKRKKFWLLGRLRDAFANLVVFGRWRNR